MEPFQNRKSMVLLLRLLKSNDVMVRLNAARVLERIKNKDIKLRISNERLSDNIFNECIYFKNTLTAIYSLEDTQRKQKKTNKTTGLEEQTALKNLLEHLLKQLDDSLETIFTILSIKYTEADMDVAFMGITNKTEESRINTVEFLSNLLDSELKDELLPLLEYHFLSERETGLKIENLSENEVLTNLLKEGDTRTKIKALNLIQYLDKGSYDKIVKKMAKENNPKISSLAKKILQE